MIYSSCFLLGEGEARCADAERSPLLKHGSAVVVFGDSITAPGLYAQMMQDALDQHAAALNIRVFSRGQAGDTAERALSRVASELVSLNPAAPSNPADQQATSPYWVLVNFGINDVGRYEVSDYLRHYEALVDEIQKSAGATVAIVSPLYPDRPTENPKLAAMVQGLKEIATRRKLLYIPVYEALKELRSQLPDRIFYALDGSHPNTMGHAVFAGTILTSLGFPDSIRPTAVDVLEREAFKQEASVARSKSTLEVALPFPLTINIRPWKAPSALAIPATKPLVLDGNLNEWDLTAPPLVLSRPEQRVLGVIRWRNEHPKTELWAAYDSEALYFAVRVRDNVVRHMSGTTGVQRDCMEIFLDQRPRASDAGDAGKAIAQAADSTYHSYLKNKTPGVTQYILPAPSAEVPSPTVAAGTGDATMLAGTRMAARLTSNGYELEFAVPKSNFTGTNGEIRPGTVLGFDFSMNDLDISDRFSTAVQLRWSGSARTPYSTDSWGTLKLVNSR
ncbi:MAG: GDSL-type esterase/lipase family protein [Candidatus Methylacidiphilales bacterium]